MVHAQLLPGVSVAAWPGLWDVGRDGVGQKQGGSIAVLLAVRAVPADVGVSFSS